LGAAFCSHSAVSAASVYWSFQNTTDALAGSGSKSGFTANDGFLGTPTVTQFKPATGPAASFGTGGASSYTYGGTEYRGSGSGAAPGFSMLWGTSEGSTGTFALAGIGFTVTLNTTGLSDLAMRFDVRSATGDPGKGVPPSRFSLIEYSYDGVAWFDTGLAAGTGWQAKAGALFEEETVNFSSISQINNQANVQLRFTFQDGSTPSADVTQNIRIDNLLFTAVPEPTSVALLGLGALALGARRRR